MTAHRASIASGLASGRPVVVALVCLLLWACSPGGTTGTTDGDTPGGRAVRDPDHPVASVECGLGTFRTGQWPTACWRPYGDDSPFNRPVPAEPREQEDSDEIVDAMMQRGPVADLVVAPDTPADWHHPVYWSQPGDPVYTVRCLRDWGTCDVEGKRVRLPARARPAGGDDGHLAVVDQQTGIEYDFWQVRPRSLRGGTLEVSWGGMTAIAGDGLDAGATAAKFGLLAGVIRAAELRAGRIDHALFMTVACTAPDFVYPATGLAATCGDDAPAPAVGQHVWLDMDADEIDALDVPDWKKTVLHALATYGAFVGDTGGNEAIGLHFESGSSYTSFGVEDPMVELARQQDAGVSHRYAQHHFDLESDVDWQEHLRILDPCVARATC